MQHCQCGTIALFLVNLAVLVQCGTFGYFLVQSKISDRFTLYLPSQVLFFQIFETPRVTSLVFKEKKRDVHRSDKKINHFKLVILLETALRVVSENG